MVNKNSIIAIDGPSASGKGTVAKKLATYLNLEHLNTGGLYRLLAYEVMVNDVLDGDIVSFCENNIANFNLDDLESEKIHSEEVGKIASKIAKLPQIRQLLHDLQRQFGKNGGVIEGRDITSVIFPDADFKFFITADVQVRARRRFEQLQNQGLDVDYQEILDQLKKRDENDFNRDVCPLKIVDDAVVIDNSDLGVDEVFDKMVKIIAKDC